MNLIFSFNNKYIRQKLKNKFHLTFYMFSLSKRCCLFTLQFLFNSMTLYQLSSCVLSNYELIDCFKEQKRIKFY